MKNGYWFNFMPSGAITMQHCHDDNDEILSGVYYVSVPNNSGKLIIHANNETLQITPTEASFIFFSPSIIHQVSKNLSKQSRLSIGFNFG